MSDRDNDLIVKLLEIINEKQDAQNDKLEKLQISVGEQAALFQAHQKQDEAMYNQLQDVDKKLAEYNHQLELHIAGVEELRRLNDSVKAEAKSDISKLETRITKLEVPRKFAGVLKVIFIELGKLAIAGAAIYAFIKMIFPNIF